MHTYSQASGEWRHDDVLLGKGYSGHQWLRNDPSAQNIPNMGPIPRGLWTIGPPEDTTTHGPYVLRLTPSKETLTFGRSGFLVHGDSSEHPGEASHGCIILPRSVREAIVKTADSSLTVV